MNTSKPAPAEDGRAAEPTPFQRMGGETAVRALVDRFYDLMDLEPGFAELRALHPRSPDGSFDGSFDGSLDGSRDKLFWFLCGWLGGPPHYTDRFGHPMLRARHMPYSIGIKERDQWLACMSQAMTEQAVDTALAARLVESFFGTADWMRNRGG